MPTLPERPPSDWKQAITARNTAFATDPKFQEEVAEYNRRYLAWDELKYRIPDPDRRKDTWAIMKLLRVLRYE